MFLKLLLETLWSTVQRWSSFSCWCKYLNKTALKCWSTVLMEQLALAEPHHKQVPEFVHTQDLYNTFPCRSVLRNEQRSTQRLLREFICIPCCPETPRTPTISDTSRSGPEADGSTLPQDWLQSTATPNAVIESIFHTFIFIHSCLASDS